jgi:prophage antirepressor-like protein
MEILKAIKLLDDKYELTIKGTIDNPLFHATQIGNILGIKNIHSSLINFNNDDKVIDISETSKGLQKTIFLTEIGLYRLICHSRKPIAHTFQKWIFNTIKEIRINGIYELKKQNEIDKKLIYNKFLLDTHNMFIKAYETKNIIYICKLKYFDDKIIIKIGSTQNIIGHILNINNQFDNIQCLLLNVIETNNYRKFEKYLHDSENIKKKSYPLLKRDNFESKKTYLLENDKLEEFIEIINQEYEKIQFKHDCEIEQMKLKFELELKQKEIELELLKYKVDNNINTHYTIASSEVIKSEIGDAQNDNTPGDSYDDDENYPSDEELDLTKTNFKLKPRTNGIKTPKVYQYHPDNLSEPVKVFDSPVDVEREKELSHLEISPAPLRNASKNNTIYKGFRWLFLNRNETLPSTIPETVHVKHKSPDIKHIAMIDIKRTRILEVFATQKDAVEARNMKCNSFTRAIQQQSVSSGHYWNFFEDCPQEWRDEYLLTRKLPERFIHTAGKKVEQIDPKTNKVLKVYNSNRDVIKLYQMSASKLRECFKTAEIHNGYIWNKVE